MEDSIPEIKITITGIIHTKNEEKYVAQAIKSLRQIVDEVIVADMGSTDDTITIARILGARVLEVPDFGFLEPALELSYAAASSDWIFRLDADELIPASLAKALRSEVDSDNWDAVSISRLNFFFGDPLFHSGWGPAHDRHFRLFKKSSMLPPTGRIHSAAVPKPGSRILALKPSVPNSLWHFNYLDWTQFFEKMNTYTTVEANVLFARKERLGKGRLVLLCSRELVGRLFVRAAFKDGYRGVILSVLMVVYRLTTYAKLRQLQEVGARESVETRYRDIATGRLHVGPGHRITDV